MAHLEIFSKREQEVVAFLLQGKSNKEIALGLGISKRTAEFHLSNIYRKLGVASRTEAILMLTKDHLRETAGILTSEELRESPVDEGSHTNENGSNPLLERRIPMKKLLPIAGGMLAITALSLLIILTNQFSKTTKTLLVEEDSPPIAWETVTSPTDTPEPMSTPTYRYIAPNIISKDDITIELLPRLSPSTFEFHAIATYPESIELADDFLFADLEFKFYKGNNFDIRLDQQAGGGGGGPGMLEQIAVFNVMHPLEIGQTITVQVIVEFNEAFGFSEPVPFDLELSVGEPFPVRGNGGG